MKKIVLILIIALTAVGCGNKKTNQVAQKSDDKLICTSKKSMGSNMPVRTCRTVAQEKQERKKNQEAMREAKSSTTGN